MDGNRAVAYIKKDTTEPFYFKNPLTLEMRGRTFAPAPESLFRKVVDTRIQVTGSKGTIYYVDPVEKTCTCPGFLYRGDCKHVKELK
jgi:hypothetical protein